MDHSDLDFCTTQQLIEELMKRRTFLGVVVRAKGDCKGSAWTDEKVFEVHYNSNLQADEAGRLLATVTEHLVGDDC